jgi:hypothetical protein
LGQIKSATVLSSLAHPPPLPAAARKAVTAARRPPIPHGQVFGPTPHDFAGVAPGPAAPFAKAAPVTHGLANPALMQDQVKRVRAARETLLQKQPNLKLEGGVGDVLESADAIHSTAMMPAAQSRNLSRLYGIPTEVKSHRLHLMNTQGMKLAAALMRKWAATFPPGFVPGVVNAVSKGTSAGTVVPGAMRAAGTQAARSWHDVTAKAIPDLKDTGAKLRAMAARREQLRAAGIHPPEIQRFASPEVQTAVRTQASTGRRVVPRGE